MSDIWLGRFSRWAEKLFNAKGGPALVDMQPSVYTTLSMDKGVDQRYLEGWNRFASSVFITAVAAQFSRCRLRNPVGSNVIIVVESMPIYASAGASDSPFVSWGPTITDLATLVTLTTSRLDPRGNPAPTAIMSFNQQAAGGLPFLQRSLAAGATADYIGTMNQEIPILPGNVVDVQSNAANLALGVGFMWRERALESSELS